MSLDFWQVVTLCLYLSGGYLLALFSYRTFLSARQLGRQLGKLDSLVGKYFPPKA